MWKSFIQFYDVSKLDSSVFDTISVGNSPLSFLESKIKLGFTASNVDISDDKGNKLFTVKENQITYISPNCSFTSIAMTDGRNGNLCGFLDIESSKINVSTTGEAEGVVFANSTIQGFKAKNSASFVSDSDTNQLSVKPDLQGNVELILQSIETRNSYSAIRVTTNMKEQDALLINLDKENKASIDCTNKNQIVNISLDNSDKEVNDYTNVDVSNITDIDCKDGIVSTIPIVPTTDSEKLTRTYEGKEFDVTDLFTFSENCGKATYSIIGGTGKGTITDNGILTVTAAGTFDIKVSTAATEACDAAEATVTLTIKKGTVTGNVIMTNYNFGGVKSVPSLNGSTSGGRVTFYYNTSNSNQDGQLWDNVTSSKTLPVGTYWMYAVVEGTDLYEEFISSPTEFKVLPESGKLPADLNGDGKVTAIDARWVLQIAAGIREVTEDERASVDLNGDGKVTAIDARWVLQVAAGIREL